ncbi:ABC transporter permease [Pelagibacterium halotolerans]|uniref:Putative nucleoside ABC transporter, permease 2 component n=1 Tax=Pelagibacterium halotolerans (strain DSM 22347 / JCM 15775 / CGMCC 1.7692 / B2) TaxID=1082931 RepID=G4RFQ6_PELHB|nr:ABC transporter permease [Pelagibacterium halotolerans]AEQ50070.1 putative nucleoside ABC transporter, permease 2 component [Pelagibacterium halotolerans B2]QJR19913.1 ABC transporter permease [Pelagibacterium halotolerans]SEA47237.1 simple sugar transport system permease protein [Pelagibacterium halotolerans]
MEDIISILITTVRVSTPLILACLAGLYSERAGIVDIGLEGKLLGSAFGAAVVASVTGNVWLGLLAGIGVSLMFSAVHGLASINFRGNQIISGVALNFLASGLTVFLGAAWFGRGGNTPALSGGARFYGIELPFAGELAGVPILGPIYSGLLSGHTILTYLAFLAVPLTAWVLWRTRFGLRLRAVGENPKALDTAGMSVTVLRYKALAITAVLVGMGGAYLSTAQAASFSREMSSGRGYIALAALIFAKWKPYPALGACLLFGFLEAMQYRLQGVDLPLIGPVPTQAMQALPYILTILLLAGFVGRAIAPKASGQPYVKER